MELADLTRGMRKNDFLEPDFFFESRACLSFMRAARKKTFFRAFFLQSWASLRVIRAVRKKQFFRA